MRFFAPILVVVIAILSVASAEPIDPQTGGTDASCRACASGAGDPTLKVIHEKLCDDPKFAESVKHLWNIYATSRSGAGGGAPVGGPGGSLP